MTLFLLAAALLTVEPEKLDVTEKKPTMRAFTDGKKHFIVAAFDQGRIFPDFVWYGDGKSFYKIRSPGGGGDRDNWNLALWEPRHDWGRARVDFKEGVMIISCGDRNTQLTLVKPDAAKALVDQATFFGYRWQRVSYLLARDDKGSYYYVDMQRDVDGKKDMKLYVGPRGKLKEQQMTNIVSDSVGDIFSTKTGELRLVSNGDEIKWVSGKTELKLTRVPVEDNIKLIYTDLGVYERMPLGTPCDDF